jgi:DnaJ-class molecular chaperone
MTIDNPCDACNGDGRVEYDAVEEVQIPAGVASEVQLRIANKGEAGDKGGPAGHLFVHVQVSPCPAQQPLHTHTPPAPPVAKENVRSAAPP